MKRRAFLTGLAATAAASSHPAMAGAKALLPRGPAPVVTGSPAGGDVVLAGPRHELLEHTVEHLARLQRVMGYGNFNLVSFDDARRFARLQSSVGEFTKLELDFLEEIFFQDPARYGFFGSKVLTAITAKIPERETLKVPRSGHYLYRGKPLALYQKVRREVGSDLVLTSGIRGIVKQMHLFLGKAIATQGNLSMAARSLAPPGHSYHGIGDFDVGKRGWGRRNFTEDFASTDEFKRLMDLGYVDIRYPEGNPFGVRYEPWHIRVV